MIEFDVDMGYLLEEGELDCVVLNDENGEHEPMTFYPNGGECEIDHERHCSNCGVYVRDDAVLVRKDLDGDTWTVVSKPINFCPNCGERIGKRRKLNDGELTELMKMQIERHNAHAERLRGEGVES